MSEEHVSIHIDGTAYEYPVFTGTEQEKAIEFSKFRSDTKYITLDNGYGSTGSCTSAITFLNGEKGVLRYRGIPIEQIAEHATFVETAYLLHHGELPTQQELKTFQHALASEYALPEDIQAIISGYPIKGHPMGLLQALMASLAGCYPELTKPVLTDEETRAVMAQIMGKITTCAAYIFHHIRGTKPIAPNADLGYVENFLCMLFGADYDMTPSVLSAMEALLILHADHEQNCSTSAVRLIGSSQANLYASISGGVGALWGPLHGGANQKVLEMLEEIHAAGGDVAQFVERAKSPDDDYRLMGFGHRVYKNFDPRATIIKQKCHDLFAERKVEDPLLDIAVQLEQIALEDEYFVKRKLYPNVDFYSGLIYKELGIPTEMFTVLFAIGRLPGWMSHWKEMKEDANTRITRPRQIYTGSTERPYIPMKKR